jgi:MFS family permease
MMLGAVLFVLLGSAIALGSRNIEWLVAVRVCQGIGIAMMSGVGAKTLVALVDASEHDRASLAATATLAGGGAFGVLMAGLLAQFAPAPLQLSYMVHLVLLAPAIAGLAIVGFPKARPIQAPNQASGTDVPPYPDSKRVVTVACLAGFVAFAVLGVFLSLAPTLVSANLALHAPIVGAAVASAMLISSSAAQLGARRWTIVRLMLSGLVLLPAGIVGFGLVMSLHSLALILVSIVAGGLGHGLIFLAGLEMLDRVSQERNRAAIASLYFASSYAGASIPVVALGFATQVWGVPASVALYSALVAGSCILIFLAFQAIRKNLGRTGKPEGPRISSSPRPRAAIASSDSDP